MMDLIDRNLIGDLVDSNGNVHYEDIMNIPSLELPSVQPVGKDINVSCKDAISRQGVKEWLNKWEGYIDRDIITRMQYRIIDIPSVQPKIVRCKDCKHRPKATRADENVFYGFSVEFPDEKCPCHCEDGWYGWYPDDDFYCGYAERRTDDER